MDQIYRPTFPLSSTFPSQRHAHSPFFLSFLIPSVHLVLPDVPGVGPRTGGWVATQSPHATHRKLASPPQHPSDANSSSERGGLSWAPALSVLELSGLSLYEPCEYSPSHCEFMCATVLRVRQTLLLSLSPTVLPCLLPRWSSNLHRKGYALDVPFRHCLGNRWFPVSGVSGVSADSEAGLKSRDPFSRRPRFSGRGKDFQTEKQYWDLDLSTPQILHVGQLWVFVLIANYCKRKLVW